MIGMCSPFEALQKPLANRQAFGHDASLQTNFKASKLACQG
jgi:hypothetical protein